MEYSSTIKSKPFLFLNFKKACSLVLQGFSDNGIKDKAIKDDIFQVNSEARKKEVASVVLKRLKSLDEFLKRQVCEGDLDTAKIIAVIGIMKSDRLFFEFMNEVFKEKLIIKDYRITENDFELFFGRKKEQSEKVAGWDDYTFYKIKQVYIRILFEAGLMRDQKSREIVKPFMRNDLIEHLNGTDRVIVQILQGIN